jgi:hypothetical protein
LTTTLASLLVLAAICSGSMMQIFDTVLIHSLESTVLKVGHAQPIQNLDGIVSESATSLNGSITGQNQGAVPNASSGLQPDDDCLFNPSLPKCAPVDGKCPPGFLMNENVQCFPDKPCPPGFAKLDEDETGTCYPVSTPTPSLSDGNNACLAPNSTLSQ